MTEKAEKTVKNSFGKGNPPIRRTVSAVTFGRFDIFVDGVVVSFTNKKAKELVALCIDRKGGIVTMEDAVDKLWEPDVYDEKAKRRYRKAVISAYRTLEEAGAKGVFVKIRGACFINARAIDCDFYKLLELDEAAVKSFRGEYMYDYSWGEKTLAWINDIYCSRCGISEPDWLSEL